MGQAAPIEALIIADGHLPISLMLIRGLDQGDRRVWHAFGPPLEELPAGYETRVLGAGPDVEVQFELAGCTAGHVHFLPPRPMQVTNN